MPTQKRLIILDRDGVINYDSPDYIKGPDEWLPIPGSLETIAKLNQAGIKVALASNQAGIARGKFSQADFEATRAKMLAYLKAHGAHLDYEAYCFDHPDKATDRRKPGPGMLFEIAKALQIELSQAVFIGDSLTDYQAAQSAKCTFALVQSGYDNTAFECFKVNYPHVPCYADLASWYTLGHLLDANGV